MQLLPTSTPTATPQVAFQQGSTPTSTATMAPSTTTPAVTPDATASASDREALVALYNATDGSNWGDNSNWLSSEPLGNWYGVTVDDNGRVIEMTLWANKLNGTLPSALGNLSKLESLDLRWNELSGSIPAELGKLSSMEYLSLRNNSLSGAFPSELGNLNNLESFYLENLNSELDKGRQESHIFVREMERRLLGLPSAGNQTGDEIDAKVGRAAMTGVFNL